MPPAPPPPTTETAEQHQDEREDADADGEAEDADQDPGQETEQAARRERAADPSEHAPQRRAASHREHEQERQHLEQARHALRRRARLRLGQGLALDDPQHAIDAGGDSAGEVAATELRDDVFLDDPVRGRVGQCALEAVTHLDPHPPILQCDQQDRAVIDAAATDLPGLGDADRVLLDFLGLRRRDDQHGDLAALRALERPQLRVERRGLVRRERSGKIGDR